MTGTFKSAHMENGNHLFARYSSVYILLIGLILFLAVLSRFVFLGDRVMSHDEVNHVVPAYALYQGRGYQHSPVTHGPLQFHLLAAIYFLFGDSDFSSRIPAAVFSVAAIAFVIFAFPRYLGRNGALIAGILFLISPIILFYGRYTRNEAFVELVGVLFLYGILRYLEMGDKTGLFLVTLSTALHFVIKETAYIYTALAMVFLSGLFLLEARQVTFSFPRHYNRFLSLILIAMSCGLASLTLCLWTPPPTENQIGQSILAIYRLPMINVLGAGAVGLVLFALFVLTRSVSWAKIKQMRSLSLLVILGSLVLPLLSPIPVKLIGYDPLNYNSVGNMAPTAIFLGLFFILSVVIGFWWNSSSWIKYAGLFWSIYIIFYTTFFTNPNGFLSGAVGSLGYWLSQQAVELGGQPHYYYVLIMLPVYEFLACMGAVLAFVIGLLKRKFWCTPGIAPALCPQGKTLLPPVMCDSDEIDGNHPLPVLCLLLFWGGSNLLTFSLAGERMPWLTVHVVLGFLLAAAWGLGYLVDSTNWKVIFRPKTLLAVLLAPVCSAASVSLNRVVFNSSLPFQGMTVIQLQASYQFVLGLIFIVLTLGGIIYLLRGMEIVSFLRLSISILFLSAGILTARAAYRASYINYDGATEYLVYAHAAPAPKEILRQVEALSYQTIGGKSIQIAYGGEALYPFWWYLRDYPNQRYFNTSPTQDLSEFPVIIAGEDLFDKMRAIVKDDYLQIEYIRMWWPNQDYWYLTWDRVWNVIANPQMRSAVFQIWLNRDYSDYSNLIDQTVRFAPGTWDPARRMRVYIRKDILSRVWIDGESWVINQSIEIDPYASKLVGLSPVQVIGSSGKKPGQFQSPRGIKVAPDGSLYVADSGNHRIQHLAPDGTVLHIWGVFGDINQGDAPGGSFNEPWDIAIGRDNAVYVSDTWNHRIQKFTADGKFLKMWGYFGQAEQADAFWGPRGLAVDANGRVYVADTGNKRVVVFDPDGAYIGQFGYGGSGPGQMDEPVGIALDSEGRVFLTDTWNQRVQVFSPVSQDGALPIFIRSWDISGWDGQSLGNKPFIAVDPTRGYLVVTDPEEPRVLVFTPNGEFVSGWGVFSSDPLLGFGLAAGVAVSSDGTIWVSDAENHVILRF